jgi:hypothetical protein
MTGVGRRQTGSGLKQLRGQRAMIDQRLSTGIISSDWPLGANASWIVARSIPMAWHRRKGLDSLAFNSGIPHERTKRPQSWGILQ